MPMRYCGREFSEEELRGIRALIDEEPQRTRSEISRIVCRTLRWYKPDGGLKEMSCRVALLRMQADELLRLPPPRRCNVNGKHHSRRTDAAKPKAPMELGEEAFAQLRVQMVSTREESALWNEYICRYHYLGYKPLAGAQLRYMVSFQNQQLALLGFGASAWKVAPRDQFIGWTAEQRERKLYLVVNNARFLILPWVHRKNLASNILSFVIRRLPADWQKRYGYRPVLLESFVECGRYRGTSYKAANWIHVGVTQGRGKLDVKNEYAFPKKDIWLYSLTKNYRQTLCF